MTMEKQKENPKFSFLFGGDFYGYYKYKLALEQQQREWGPRLTRGRHRAAAGSASPPTPHGHWFPAPAGGAAFLPPGLAVTRQPRFAASSRPPSSR